MVMKLRRRLERQERAERARREAELIGKQVFVTSPPGFGSIVPATPESELDGVVFSTEEELAEIRRMHFPVGRV